MHHLLMPMHQDLNGPKQMVTIKPMRAINVVVKVVVGLGMFKMVHRKDAMHILA